VRFRPHAFALGVSLVAAATPLFAAGSGPVGSEFEVDPEFSSGARAFPEAGGTYVVLWNDLGGARLRRYDAAGAPVAPSSPLSPAASFFDVARDGAGNFVLAQGGSDGYSYGVFGQRFDAAGTALAPQFQVNTYTTGGQRTAGIGVDASGKFLIVWNATVGALGSFYDVYGQAFDASASPAGGEFLVNGSTSDSASGARAVADGAGNFVVAWQNGPGLFARRFDPTGAPLGAEFQVNTFTSGGHGLANMVADGTGGFVIVWQGSGIEDVFGVFGRRYDSTGTPLGPQFVVNTYTTGVQYAPTIAAGPGGNFVVMWRGENVVDLTGIAARRFDGAGVPLGPDFQVNTFTEGESFRPHAVLHPSGAFTIFWDGGAGVRGQRFDAAGAPVPGDVPIGGKRLLIRNPVDPSRRRVVFNTTDPNSVNGINPAIRPDVQGMYLHVYNTATGDSACMPLPAGNWDPTDDIDDLYFYRDPDFVNGPCRTAKLRRNRSFSANCRGSSIGFTLDEPTQGSVVVAAILGNARYCTVFGGTVTKDSGADGIFKAKNAVVPASCPVPPVPCP
jgi:hypothetical protein